MCTDGFKLCFVALVCKYLYVDEVFAVLDDMDISLVDGLLVVFDAGGPVGGRAQDLREGRGMMGSVFCVTVTSAPPKSFHCTSQ